MEGNDVANSDRLKCDMRGEDEVDEDGEGGPKLEVGTRAWGDGAAALAKVGEASWVKLGGEGKLCKEMRCGLSTGISGCVDDGSIGEATSRERRLFADTTKPPLCSERIRSAMLVPTARPGLSSSSSLLVDPLCEHESSPNGGRDDALKLLLFHQLRL